MTTPDADVMVPRIALEALSELTTGSAATSRQLIASYRAQVYRLQAELQMIRDDTELLFRQQWMPTPMTVMGALRPDPKEVAKLAAALEAEADEADALSEEDRGPARPQPGEQEPA